MEMPSTTVVLKKKLFTITRTIMAKTRVSTQLKTSSSILMNFLLKALHPKIKIWASKKLLARCI